MVKNGGDIGETLPQLGSDESIKNLLAAMITAGLTQNYAGQYTAESFVAKTATGCAVGPLTGAGCQQGATVGAVLHGLSYLGDLARADQIEGSSKGIRIMDASGKELSNISGESIGINGDGIKLGGERLSFSKICENVEKLCNGTTLKPEYYDAATKTLKLPTDMTVQSFVSKYIKDGNDISPLGGIQGWNGQVLGVSYKPGGFADMVVESFGGTHDWLNYLYY